MGRVGRVGRVGGVEVVVGAKSEKERRQIH